MDAIETHRIQFLLFLSRSSSFDLFHHDTQLGEGGTDRMLVSLTDSCSLFASNQMYADGRVAIQDDIPNSFPGICSLEAGDLIEDRDCSGQVANRIKRRYSLSNLLGSVPSLFCGSFCLKRKPNREGEP